MSEISDFCRDTMRFISTVGRRHIASPRALAPLRDFAGDAALPFHAKALGQTLDVFERPIKT